MPLGILFWVIYVIALLFGAWSNYAAGDPLWTRRAGAYGVLWLLVGFLGWAVFGAVVK
jgi:hypothetical protein